MAVMTDQQIDNCWAQFMQTAGQYGEVFTCLKSEGRALIAALDAYLNTNASAINNAIPQPARGAFTTAMKARALKAVVDHRYLNGL